MGRSFSNITVHIIFHCKNGACLIKEDDLPEVFHYIGGIIRAESGYAYIVGGRPDHIHILTSVPVKTSLADFVRAIKANTSRWVKGLHADYQHFHGKRDTAPFPLAHLNSTTLFITSKIKKNIIGCTLHRKNLCAFS